MVVPFETKIGCVWNSIAWWRAIARPTRLDKWEKAVKFGLRTPSLRKSLAARMSFRRVIRHSFGIKAPRGFGWVTNPKKAAYNRIYNRTTFGLRDFARHRRGRRKNNVSTVAALFYLLLFFLMVSLAVTFWPLALVAFLAWVFAGVALGRRKAKRAQLLPLIEKFQKHLASVRECKTFAARVHNCEAAIILLEQIKELDPQRAVLANSDSLSVKLGSLSKILPVLNTLDKADRAEFKGQRKKALDAYLDILYQCRKENITDNDFEAFDARTDLNHEHISLDHIQEKARRLGGTGEWDK